MTKNDIKQYLEKIYKIDVLDVTTIIKQGLNKMIFYYYWFVVFVLGKENRHPVTSEIIDPDPDRKFAYVFLVNMKTFFD